MKIKVSEASGPVLDWMVAKAEGHDWRNAPVCAQYAPASSTCWMPWLPSTDWSQGGPIIERGELSIEPQYCAGELVGWVSYGHNLKYDSQGEFIDGSDHRMVGPTPLIAAMRCFVASKLGDEVEVPGELA